jgi:hypothetical protein
MLSRAVKQLLNPRLTHTARMAMNHIKNMNEENVRVIAEQMEKESMIIKTDRVYKPTYTIEFDRTGEALLYSANPLKNETIYFKYPYIFCKHSLMQTNPSCL